MSWHNKMNFLAASCGVSHGVLSYLEVLLKSYYEDRIKATAFTVYRKTKCKKYLW